MALIPATILTGFLGSGKTTLLKRVLSEAHGQKIAVIENEFGEENIDSEILVQDSREQIIQLNNGCVCCSNGQQGQHRYLGREGFGRSHPDFGAGVGIGTRIGSAGNAAAYHVADTENSGPLALGQFNGG